MLPNIPGKQHVLHRLLLLVKLAKLDTTMACLDTADDGNNLNDIDVDDDYYWARTEDGPRKILKCNARQALTMVCVTQVQVLRYVAQQLADIKKGMAGLTHPHDDKFRPTTPADDCRFFQMLAAMRESVRLAEAVLGGARFAAELSHFLLDEALYSPHVLGGSARAEADSFKNALVDHEAHKEICRDSELQRRCARGPFILAALEAAIAMTQHPESSFSRCAGELQTVGSLWQFFVHYRGPQCLRDDLTTLCDTVRLAAPITRAIADEIRDASHRTPAVPAPNTDGVPTWRRQFPNVSIPGTLHRVFQSLHRAGFEVITALRVAELSYLMGCALAAERVNRTQKRHSRLALSRWSTPIMVKVWDCHFRAENMAEACIYGQRTTPLLEQYWRLWEGKPKWFGKGRDEQEMREARIPCLSSLEAGYKTIWNKLTRTKTLESPK